MRTSDQLLQMLDILTNHANLYYEPPSGTLMMYPCMRITQADLDLKRADNKKYLATMAYTLTYITENDVDILIDPITSALLDLEYCEFDRTYVSDNMHHYVFKIYY